MRKLCTRYLAAQHRTSHFRCWVALGEDGVGLKVTSDKAAAKADACGASSYSRSLASTGVKVNPGRAPT